MGWTRRALGLPLFSVGPWNIYYDLKSISFRPFARIHETSTVAPKTPKTPKHELQNSEALERRRQSGKLRDTPMAAKNRQGDEGKKRKHISGANKTEPGTSPSKKPKLDASKTRITPNAKKPFKPSKPPIRANFDNSKEDKAPLTKRERRFKAKVDIRCFAFVVCVLCFCARLNIIFPC